jgi:hypothetical protein
LRALLKIWTHADDAFIEKLAAGIFSKIFSSPGNMAINEWADRIPQGHSERAASLVIHAYMYTQAHKDRNIHLRAVTGHSLGGALAQWVCEQTGPGGRINIKQGNDSSMSLPGLSFNGPFMGDLQGMRLGAGGELVCVNNIRDPLSKLTKLAGAKDHATHKSVEIDAGLFKAPPPSPYENNWTTLYSDVKSNFTTYKDVAFAWYGAAALYYHGIDTLVAYLESSNAAIGRRHLQMAFL